jgi:predicted transglutaminase-like cysteine proteinase
MKMTVPVHLRKTVTLAALPDGVAGVRATLALMVNIARQSKNNFAVRSQALQLVQSLPQKDYLAEVRAIQEYVRDGIRYVRDITDIETLATPIQTIQSMQGDCDDKALLASALLESIGHPTRFVAVGRSPGEFEHVLIETKMFFKGGVPKWIPVETTEPVPVGWYPPGMTQRLVYHVNAKD